MKNIARFCLLAVALGACMKAPDPADSKRHAAAAPAQDVPVLSSQVGVKPKFHFQAPGGWKEMEADQAFYLRKWEIPGGDGANCTVSFLGPMRGTLDQNVDRWLAQFEVPGSSPRAEAMIGQIGTANHPVTLVELAGTLIATRSVGGGPPRKDWMVVGGIIESVKGPVFVKALGPREVMESYKDEIRIALGSAVVE